MLKLCGQSLQLAIDAPKQGIAAGQQQVDTTHADPTQGSNLEQLQTQGETLSLS